MTASPRQQVESTNVRTGVRNFANSALVADIFRSEA